MSRYCTICQYVCLRCSSPAQEMDCSPKPKATGGPTKKGHSTLLPTVLLSNEIAAAEEIHILSFSPCTTLMKHITLAAMSTGWANLA